jgi:leader peptidase (prepilin peptidase)/N-methyltransferase
VALAVFDAEHLWLPDRLTWPGIAVGTIVGFLSILPLIRMSDLTWKDLPRPDPIYLLGEIEVWLEPIIAAAIAAGLILLIRWVYKLVRHREGLGLGDAKLMAMLAAWLGLPGALLSFAIGVVLGSVVAIVVLAGRKNIEGSKSWAGMKLPLGTFLCIGGILSSLWGQPIIAAYMRWAGF